jgi:hypothetical protein
LDSSQRRKDARDGLSCILAQSSLFDDSLRKKGNSAEWRKGLSFFGFYDFMYTDL